MSIFNNKKISKSSIVFIGMSCVAALAAFGCAKNMDADQSSTGKETTGTPLSKVDHVAAPEDLVTEAMKQSRVLSDPKKRAFFTGMEKLKVLPPEKTLEALSSWFASDESDDILSKYGSKRRWKQPKEDISDLKRQIKIGVPYELYNFPMKHLLDSVPFSVKDLEIDSYIYPLIRNNNEVADTWVGPEGTMMRVMSSSRSTDWPTDEDTATAVTKKRVRIATRPYMFQCFGIYPEDSDIGKAVFRCRQEEWGSGMQKPTEIGNKMTFEQICQKAQEFFNRNLRILKGRYENGDIKHIQKGEKEKRRKGYEIEKENISTHFVLLTMSHIDIKYGRVNPIFS